MHETPQNAGYMIAAYVVTAVVPVGYWVRLAMKLKAKKLEAEG